MSDEIKYAVGDKDGWIADDQQGHEPRYGCTMRRTPALNEALLFDALDDAEGALDRRYDRVSRVAVGEDNRLKVTAWYDGGAMIYLDR